MVLQEGGPQATPTVSSGSVTSAGGKGGGEGGRSGRKTAAKTSHAGQTGSSAGVKGSGVGGDGVKSLLNPLAIVASSGQCWHESVYLYVYPAFHVFHMHVSLRPAP